MRWSQPRCDGSLLVIVVYCVTRVGVTTVLSTVVVMGWFRNMTLSHFSQIIQSSRLSLSPVLL